jgi:hypothetical protein
MSFSASFFNMYLDEGLNDNSKRVLLSTFNVLFLMQKKSLKNFLFSSCEKEIFFQKKFALYNNHQKQDKTYSRMWL